MQVLKTNLAKDKHYLVAVSFGPDSMALLHHLFSEGFNITVAHVNYHKRKESDLEQSQLEQWCFAKNIACFVLDVNDIKKGNFQAEARNIRYQFFKTVIAEEKLDALLTAHHQDDHLETALFQMQRHSTHPYFGIKRETTIHDMLVIHPLLNYAKATLLKYCEAHHVPYAIDASNASTLYTRNRLRKTIQGYTAKVREAKLEAIEQLNQHMEEAHQFVLPFTHKPSMTTQDYQAWTVIQRWMYWYALSESRQAFRPITDNLIKTIDRLTKSAKPNIVMPWNANHRLYQSYGRIQLIHVSALKKYTLNVKNKHTKIVHPLWTIAPNKMTHTQLRYPLKIRQPLASDKYLVDGHKKSLSRLMIDWKMPVYLRKVWPVFVYQNKIVYIPRYRRREESNANDWLIVNE